MRSALQITLLISGLASTACSGDKSKSNPMTASGEISLGGTPQEVASCAMSGSGVTRTLVLHLKTGAIVILPIHESTVVLQASADAERETLSCENHEKDGSGSDVHYDGQITLACGAGESALMMSLSIQCGVAGPSNRSGNEKPAS